MELGSVSREELIRIIEQQQVLIEELQARVAELEAGRGKPHGMPGNKIERKKPSKPKQERKHRDQNFVRPRSSEPDERIEHAYDKCPGCGTGLTGGSVKRTREVIEVRPTPAIVTEHAYIERCCPYCEQRYTPPAELEGVVLGKSRLDTGLISLIASLKEEARLPVGKIRWYLETFHQLKLSAGAIIKALRRVAERGEEQVEQTLAAVRESPYINADETGWREDGVNGYVWVYSSPEGCYFLRAGRDQGVVEHLLGDGQFRGVLICDFYASYNCYRGPIQRCWAHLLRDLHELVEDHPQDVAVVSWAENVRKLYEEAKSFADAGGRELSERYSEQWRLRDKLLRVCEPYLGEENAPHSKLSRRIYKHIHELFVFYPGVPSHNNQAERDLRHLVTIRKVSGGTRSSTGTQTKMTLASLFATWRANNLNPFLACLYMLTSPVV